MKKRIYIFFLQLLRGWQNNVNCCLHDKIWCQRSQEKRETQKTHQSLVIVGLSSLVTPKCVRTNAHRHRLHTTLITCECIFICTAFFSTPLSNPIGLLWCVFVILSAKQQEKTNNIEIGLVCFFQLLLLGILHFIPNVCLDRCVGASEL